MTLYPALLNSMTALKAIGTGIRVTSDNVANANNEEYNKRITKYQNYVFGGVQVADIERVANEGLNKDLRNAIALAARDETAAGYYTQLEEITGVISNNPALTEKVEAFVSAYKAFEAAPESGAAEREVVLAGQSLVSELHRVSNGIEQIDRSVKDDTILSVTELNTLLTEIDALNDKIIRDSNLQIPTANLENIRDAKLDDLSEIMEIRTFKQNDNRMTVYSSTGLALVDAVAEQFTWDETTQTLTRTGSTVNVADQVSTGRLRAQLDFIRTDAASVASSNALLAPIEKLRNQLDDFARLWVDVTTAQTFGEAYRVNPAPPLFGGGAPYTADWDELFFIPLDPANDLPADVDRFNIQVRPALVSGADTVPQQTANDVIEQLDASSRALSAGALVLASETYSGISSGILARLVSNAGVVDQDATLEIALRDDLQIRLDNEVRVDIDEEMAVINILQNSYAANARVVNTVNELFDDLMNTIR